MGEYGISHPDDDSDNPLGHSGTIFCAKRSLLLWKRQHDIRSNVPRNILGLEELQQPRHECDQSHGKYLLIMEIKSPHHARRQAHGS